MQNSFTGLKIFDNYSLTGHTGKKNNYNSVRRPESMRKSRRKPIFDNKEFYTSMI